MKRLIIIMFLIAIFPLVTISYAIDKIADGKSQAFNRWCKEFMLQVFVQSFHAINYVLVMGIVFRLDDSQWLFKILAITYVAKGGDILRGLFAQMKGGGATEKMEVAKAFVKGKVMLNSINMVKGAVSGMVGSNSLLGRGINRINEGRAQRLEGVAAREELKTRQALRATTTPPASMPLFNSDGTAREIDMSDEEIKKNLETVLSGDASDEEIAKAADNLANLSEEQLEKALGDLGILSGDARREELESLLNCAIAAKVLTTKDVPPVNIQTSVECLINEKKNPSPLVEKYFNQNSKLLDERNLHRIAGANSISVEQEKINERRASEPDRTGETQEDRVRRAMTAIRNAAQGEYDIEELHEHYNVVKSAQNSSNNALKTIVRQEEATMNYSLDDFHANLQVQTINHSANSFGDAEAQSRIDEAIRFVKAESATGRHKEVLKGLNADIDKLEEGYLPELIDRQAQEKAKLQKEFAKRMSDDPYSVDLGEEYDQYLQLKADELIRNGNRDILFGTATAIAGGASLPAHLATSVVSTAVAAGATTQNIGDVGAFASSTTAALGMATGALTGVERLGESVVTLPGKVIDKTAEVFDDVGEFKWKDRVILDGHKIAGAIQPEKAVDLGTNRASMAINKKYYQEQAKLDYANRKISDRERERQKLLDRINKKAGDAADDK